VGAVTVLGLYVRRRSWWSGKDSWEPITSAECWSCGRPQPDLAHTVMEHVLSLMATELERRVAAAITEHQAEHGCGDTWFVVNQCDAAGDLIDLLPDAMLPVAIG
jgi:hypothetical protein